MLSCNIGNYLIKDRSEQYIINNNKNNDLVCYNKNIFH